MPSLCEFDSAIMPTVATVPAPRVKAPTPQQRAIYDAIARGADHVAVEALAGTGKTTTACGCAGAAGGKRGFVAFNKHIAGELEHKLGGKAKACTMHSLGFAAVRRQGGSVEVDDRKANKELERIAPHRFRKSKAGRVYPTTEARAILDVARLCKLTLTDETDAEAVRNLIGYYGVDDCPSDVAPAVAELLEACINNRRSIDFDDMIWLPVRLGLPVEQFDLLMVDECQDLNRCQQELAKAACRSGRIVPIGDRFQSIYGFTGADPDAMPRLVRELECSNRGASTRPLTVTFRCPYRHVRLARKLVPEIEAADWAEDGDVEHLEPDALPAVCRPGDLVICRRNAPLVSATFQLIAAGVPAVMIGRDFAKGLTALIDRLWPRDAADLIAKLREYQEKEEEKLERKDASESHFQALRDKCLCLKELAAQVDTIAELRATIDRLFADACDADKVVRLASVHRAKGSEADRVFILEPELMPMVGRKTKAWEVQQEKNILYIALTRAKESLYFCGPLPQILDRP